MSVKLSSMSDSFALVIRKGVRFAFTGIVVTLVHVILAIVSIELFHLSQVVANSFAFTLATLLSYCLNTRWSFTSKLGNRSLVRFMVVACIGLFVAAGISAMAQFLGWPYVYGITLIVCVIPLISFSLHVLWTYK